MKFPLGDLLRHSNNECVATFSYICMKCRTVEELKNMLEDKTYSKVAQVIYDCVLELNNDNDFQDLGLTHLYNLYRALIVKTCFNIIIIDKKVNSLTEIQKEEIFWKYFYLNFNDDNINHCDNAFISQGFETMEEVLFSNIKWVQDILERNSFEDIMNNNEDVNLFFNNNLKGDKTYEKK